MPEMGAGNQVGEQYRINENEHRFGTAHRSQLADFVRAITEGGLPRVGTAEARTTLSVVLALYESARTGKPVRL
jgi:predicted dehydrogenase